MRLRRVCKFTKSPADGYLRCHFSEQEREINETEDTFAHYIRRNLPTARLYLNNSGPEFFENPNVYTFLDRYAYRITHLRVNHFSTCVSELETLFYSSLPNLESLEIQHTDASERDRSTYFREVNGERVPRELTYLPPTFKNLKVLKLNYMKTSHFSDQGYFFDLVRFCDKLEHLKQPRFLELMDGVSEFDGGTFGIVTDLIRRTLDGNQLLALKTYDMEHYNDVGLHSFGFLNLLIQCVRSGVKLQNVDAALLEILDAGFEDDLDFSVPLESVKNVHGLLLDREIPGLKKLVIKSTQECSIDQNAELPLWPALEKMEVNIDSKEIGSGPYGAYDSVKTKKLLELLFASAKRPKLVELRVGFAWECGENLPCPRSMDIIENCGNLTKIYLQNWMGTNRALSLLWNGLLLLEEVTLDQCKMLADVAFVGEDRENPTFFKLQSNHNYL